MVSLKTDHHPELSLSPADRDHWPQWATDLCRAVEGLIHESRLMRSDITISFPIMWKRLDEPGLLVGAGRLLAQVALDSHLLHD